MRYLTLLAPTLITLMALWDVGKPYVPQTITHYTGELPVMVGLLMFGMWFLGFLSGNSED